MWGAQSGMEEPMVVLTGPGSLLEGHQLFRRGSMWLWGALIGYKEPMAIMSVVVYLEDSLAAAVELHAKPNAAGFTGAGELPQ